MKEARHRHHRDGGCQRWDQSKERRGCRGDNVVERCREKGSRANRETWQLLPSSSLLCTHSTHLHWKQQPDDHDRTAQPSTAQNKLPVMIQTEIPSIGQKKKMIYSWRIVSLAEIWRAKLPGSGSEKGAKPRKTEQQADNRSMLFSYSVVCINNASRMSGNKMAGLKPAVMQMYMRWMRFRAGSLLLPSASPPENSKDY